MASITFPTLTVIKRDNRTQQVQLEKISNRLTELTLKPYPLRINPVFVAKKVIPELVDGIQTYLLDEYAAKVAYEMSLYHPDYAILASRILISNHQKRTLNSFSDTMEACYRNSLNGVPVPRINTGLHKFVQIHKTVLNSMIDYSRDFNFTYFGATTLIMQNYLLKKSGPGRQQDLVLERPQDMWLRVACSLHMNRDNISDTGVLSDIKETYDLLSLGKYTHGSPTLFNAGTNREQLLSCFLLGSEDSIEGIFKTIRDMAIISKHSGGIGFHWGLRSTGSEVKSTNGTSAGMIPFLRIPDLTAAVVDQGGKRPGAFAHYLEPTHPEIVEWLRLGQNTNVEKFEELFLALWISDDFMKAVDSDSDWYLFNPVDTPDLYTTYGLEYSKLRQKYVSEKKYVEVIKARELWDLIIDTQIMSGTPYIMFKDTVNERSNQKNIGAIQSSNLCAEIVEYSSSDEYACCCVASICVNKFVTKEYECDCVRHTRTCKVVKYGYDFKELARTAGLVTKNMNRVIDVNFYPVPEAERSNMLHRPLAIGIQGLADTFADMRLPFTGPEAMKLNKEIFEAIYYGCLRASCDLAKVHGKYSTFDGSPMSQGILQFHYSGLKESDLSGMWPWTELIADIKEHGTRNSLLTSLPPTASTSQIQGNNESFEAFTSNVYKRTTTSGNFYVINNYLVEQLIERDLWTDDVRNKIVDHGGSIQKIDEIPDDIKQLYLTVWEMSGQKVIDMMADRCVFVDQSASNNQFMYPVSKNKLTSMHFYTWRKKLKTGMYYLRTLKTQDAQNFSKPILVSNTITAGAGTNVCSRENKDCESCSA